MHTEQLHMLPIMAWMNSWYKHRLHSAVNHSFLSLDCIQINMHPLLDQHTAQCHDIYMYTQTGQNTGCGETGKINRNNSSPVAKVRKFSGCVWGEGGGVTCGSDRFQFCPIIMSRYFVSSSLPGVLNECKGGWTFMESKFYSAFHWMQPIVIMDSFYTSIHFNTNGTQQCCQHTSQLQRAFTSSTVYCKE